MRDADTFAVNGYLECAEPTEGADRQLIRFERRGESEQAPLESTSVPELHFDLYTRHSLDREEGAPVRLARLVCWDGGGVGLAAGVGRAVSLTSTLTLSIHVQDRNDNVPIFTQTSFTAELEENSDIRKEILQVLNLKYAISSCSIQ